MPPKPVKPRAVAVIVAGGRGLRAGSRTPKQFISIGGRSLLDHVLERFSRHPSIGRIILVAPVERLGKLRHLPSRHRKLSAVVGGGARRQDSVMRGVEQVEGDSRTIVVVHDAARPFVSRKLIGDVIDAASRHGAAVPGLPVADTVKEVTAAGRVAGTLVRERLRLIQTPQAFRLGWLRRAAGAAAGRRIWTDEAAILEAAGRPVQVVAGEPENFKLTTAADIRRARKLLA